MATTSIMPLHTGKGRSVRRAIQDSINYVKNPAKTDEGRLVTSYQCNGEIADAEFLLAKRQYIAATGRVRGKDDIIAYHLRQSFVPGEITPEEANRLGRSWRGASQKAITPSSFAPTSTRRTSITILFGMRSIWTATASSAIFWAAAGRCGG